MTKKIALITKKKKTRESIIFGIFVISALYLGYALNNAFVMINQNQIAVSTVLDKEKNILVKNVRVESPVRSGSPISIRGTMTINKECTFYNDSFVFSSDGVPVWRKTESMIGKIMLDEPFERKLDIGTLEPGIYSYQVRARALCDGRTVPLITPMMVFTVVQ